MSSHESAGQTSLRYAELILARVVWCALILLPFGVYVSWMHFPAGTPAGLYWISMLWGAGLAMLLGAAAGALAGGMASLARSIIGGKWGVITAAGLETVVFASVFLWLLLNEAVCALTYEVFGWDTFLYLFYNPKAVLEASWEMAGKYMLVVFLGAGLFAAMIFVGLRRLHLRSGGRRKVWGERATVVGVGTIVGVVLVVFVWQFFGRPSVALATLSRSAPALRAVRLPRALLGDQLFREDVKPIWGPPVISEEQYAKQLGKPDPALNVIVMILESVPAKVLGCYGRDRDVTPNMDALADGGALFEHCAAAASFSSYSLVSTITSLYMLREERHDHFRDTEFPFFGIHRMFKLAGYETALFSSGNESFENIRRFYPQEDFDKYLSHDTCDVKKWDSMRMDDRHVTEEFESWAAKRPDDRPMFCLFNLQSTHFNYEIQEPWASHYQPVPEGYTSGNAIIYMPPDLVPLMQNAYDNALRYMDHCIGRICEALKRKGIFDDTIIVIVGDHGEGFMEHGLARHGVHLYEEMVHVPLIVHAPRVLKPRQIASTVSQLDIAPTLAGLVGLQPHPSWQGQDVLSADYEPAGRAVFTVLQLTRWQEAVYLDGVKYIYDLSECEDYLFDLQADPGERVNLVDQQPALRQTMQDLLGRWHTRQLAYYGAKNRPFPRYIGTMGRQPDLVETISTARSTSQP